MNCPVKLPTFEYQTSMYTARNPQSDMGHLIFPMAKYG